MQIVPLIKTNKYRYTRFLKRNQGGRVFEDYNETSTF